MRSEKVTIKLEFGSWKAYDSTAYSGCYSKPRALLYKGGIVTNADFEEGLKGWSPIGNCVLQLRRSSSSASLSDMLESTVHQDHANYEDGASIYSFVVATNRTASYNGPSQLLLNVTTGMKYSISAWVQVTGPTPILVKATVVLDGGKQYVCTGTVVARSGCWSFLKGGFSLDHTPTASTRLYFETFNFTSGVELWLARVSVQPFQDDEWLSHQRARRELLRRRTVSVSVVDPITGKMLHDADIEIVDAKLGFNFGSAITQNFLTNRPYQNWFLKRFNTAVFGNELKWYATEPQQGKVNYNISDAMMAFCEAYNLSIRGHNVVWDDPKFQQPWVKALVGRPLELQRVVMERISSVVGHYAGRVLDWDVSNEQLHFSFYEDALGDPNASTKFFLAVQDLDPTAELFVNEYNTIEDCNDPVSSPDAYIAKVHQLQSAGVANLGIGLEAHFSKPNIAYIRSTLDKLATLGLPIWLTELDINMQALSNNFTKAATYLEEILREAYAHPAVAGIVMWTAMDAKGSCWRMCLTDANMNNLATGEVVDRLLTEWQQVEVLNMGGAQARYSRSGGSSGGTRRTWRGPVGTHSLSIGWRNTTYSATITVSAGKGTQHVLVPLPISSIPTSIHTGELHLHH